MHVNNKEAINNPWCICINFVIAIISLHSLKVRKRSLKFRKQRSKRKRIWNSFFQQQPNNINIKIKSSSFACLSVPTIYLNASTHQEFSVWFVLRINLYLLFGMKAKILTYSLMVSIDVMWERISKLFQIKSLQVVDLLFYLFAWSLRAMTATGLIMIWICSIRTSPNFWPICWSNVGTRAKCTKQCSLLIQYWRQTKFLYWMRSFICCSCFRSIMIGSIRLDLQ